MMKTKGVLAIFILGILLVSAFACGGGGESEATPTPTPTPKPSTDTTPPIISEVSAMHGFEAPYPATWITWVTDEPATSQVDYGKTPDCGLSTPLEEYLVVNHSVALRSLEPDITYHCRVKSRDASGNLAISSNYTFITPLLPGVEDKDEYATAIKIVDSKGNCELHSEYNGQWPSYTGDELYRPVKVGETITIAVDVYNAIADPVLYQFTGEGSPGIWQQDNEVTITVTDRLQTFWCCVFVKNSDERYRSPDFDDMIRIYYRLVP